MTPGMQTEPDPSSNRASVGNAVGLTFVAVVLVSLFAGGALGVLATRSSAEGPQPGPETPAADAAGNVAPVRDQVIGRFKELMLLREIAIRERNLSLLESVYLPGAPGLARDRAEIERLRRSDRRLDGLRLPVRVVDASQPDEGRWVVVARLGRSPAKLVTGSGRLVKGVPGSSRVHRCTLVKRDGRWVLLRLARS
jgi:hypothetical protein